MPEAEIDEISKIKEYLEKNNISIKDLKETADELLYEKVIGDWEKYTNSRYSKDNLGTVKIERSQLFDGVDQGKIKLKLFDFIKIQENQNNKYIKYVKQEKRNEK